jgi:DinB family protein
VNALWRTVVWLQFGAAINMLENALRACPDELWEERLWDDGSTVGSSAFWYLAYHTLFWLDLYLSGSADGFVPPAPFTLDELDPAGLLPSRVYSRAELDLYLAHTRQKCRATIESLTDEQAQRVCLVGGRQREMPFAELLLYTMRYVQEHAAQLSLFIGQRAGSAFPWVYEAGNP